MDKPKKGLTGFAFHLVTQKLIDEAAMMNAQTQAQANHVALIHFLAEGGLIESSKLANEAANYFGLSVFDLASYDKTFLPKDLLNLSIVQARQAIPLHKTKNSLMLGVADPMISSTQEVKFLTGLNLQLVLVEATKLNQMVETLLSSQLITGLGDLNDASLDQVDVSAYEDRNTNEAPETAVDDTPIVRYVNKTLIDAIQSNASDIHFEPYESYYRIRFRRDGLLHKIATPPLRIANYLVARIKIMSNLDISERRVPQDGRFKLILSKHRTMDFRVSTCPTLYGEKVVMRLLNTSQALPDLESLGMSETQKDHFAEALAHSQGMILVSGPTGSGKTVTLYTALGILNTIEKNISTAEDPVEIPVPGINQVQINLKTGLTFSVALRSFLRQDPDIIMVGEIRDLETAEIGVKAAQTGHLVLSTLHTNSASETVLRLANMGVAAFNLASSLLLIIAQRLVRKLCDDCKKPVSFPKEVLISEGFKEDEIKNLKIFGPGDGDCKKCYNGYKGRQGIFEVMPITDPIANLIMSNGNAIELMELARREGVISLRESGLTKVREGITSLEELNRVFKG